MNEKDEAAAQLLREKEEAADKIIREKEEEAKRIAAAKVAEEQRKAEEQKKEYERLLKEEQTRNYRNMILEEIQPIVEEMNRIKAHIKADEKEFENKINGIKDHHITDKEDVDEKFIKIRESYKFRFIQLCRSHLRDGYITTEEWDQIVAFYDLYHSLGGNGQAEDYYEQVKQLEIVD